MFFSRLTIVYRLFELLNCLIVLMQNSLNMVSHLICISNQFYLAVLEKLIENVLWLESMGGRDSSNGEHNRKSNEKGKKTHFENDCNNTLNEHTFHERHRRWSPKVALLMLLSSQ